MNVRIAIEHIYIEKKQAVVCGDCSHSSMLKIDLYDQ